MPSIAEEVRDDDVEVEQIRQEILNQKDGHSYAQHLDIFMDEYDHTEQDLDARDDQDLTGDEQNSQIDDTVTELEESNKENQTVISNQIRELCNEVSWTVLKYRFDNANVEIRVRINQ